jgi:hypothetical protein
VFLQKNREKSVFGFLVDFFCKMLSTRFLFRAGSAWPLLAKFTPSQSKWNKIHPEGGLLGGFCLNKRAQAEAK